MTERRSKSGARVPPGTELIILEGWCVGLSPQPTAELAPPVNDLEREQDADLVWREATNEQLSGPYAALFAELDALLFLQAPHFDAVLEWRWEQEQQLSARYQSAHPADRRPHHEPGGCGHLSSRITSV